MARFGSVQVARFTSVRWPTSGRNTRPTPSEYAFGLGMFVISCLSRGRSTALPATAKCASVLYSLAPPLVGGGFLWKHLAYQPPIVAILMVGAGIWCVGFAWTCTAALWNGG